MYSLAKILIVMLLSSQILNSTETIIKVVKIKDKFCKDYKSDGLKSTFCTEYITTYPMVDSSNKNLEKYLNLAIKKYGGVEKRGNAKKFVLFSIKNGDASSFGHKNNFVIEVLSILPKSFTLEMRGYNYFGGADASYYTSFVNYDRKTGKEIKIDKFFIEGYKKILTKIVEKKYRNQKHISSSDSLVDKLGWFENKFILPKSIGIGKDGLHFAYSSYEVKADRRLPTHFVVSYELLKEIIKPNSNFNF